jgi:hypothetical protein
MDSREEEGGIENKQEEAKFFFSTFLESIFQQRRRFQPMHTKI